MKDIKGTVDTSIMEDYPEYYKEIEGEECSYELYIVKHKDKLVYIGEGLTGRHTHATSGISHVYGLNYLHFQKEPVDVFTTPMISKEAAMKYEKMLIRKLLPTLNYRGGGVKVESAVVDKVERIVQAHVDDKFLSSNKNNLYILMSIPYCYTDGSVILTSRTLFSYVKSTLGDNKCPKTIKSALPRFKESFDKGKAGNYIKNVEIISRVDLKYRITFDEESLMALRVRDL